VSGKHLGDFFINQYLTESCGPFRDIVDEYLIGFATLHYRNPKSVRSSLGRFCLFLNERHIDSLEKVTPATITEFIVWANKKADGNGATNTVPSISTFFKWLIAGGRRTAANPVVGLIHGQRKTRRMPRPYKEHELNFIWELLRERGNLRLRLATAIAEEAGLRIAEVCRLRTADVDVEQQRLFIRLPNKTSRERYAFFSRKTSQYYDEWMRERDSECGHDCLLYNAHGNPWTTQSLTAEFKNVLCTKFKGKKIHDTGLEVWSMHRLRHTMATNLVSGGADAATVMAAGGWVSHESMAIYAEVDPAVARHGYNEAVRRAREQREAGPRTRTLSPAEFLKLRQIGDEVEQVEDTPERCV
jgi:integrase/recombinase XerC